MSVTNRAERTRLLVQCGAVAGSLLVLAHQFLVNFDRNISILGVNFGPGGGDASLQFSSALLVVFLPAQIILLHERLERKLNAIIISCSVGYLSYLTLIRVSRDTTAYYSHFVPVLPVLSGMAAVSLGINVLLLLRRSRVVGFLDESGTRVVTYMFESRRVIPIFLAGFMLTIFNSEIVRVVTRIDGSMMILLVGGGVLVSASLAKSSESGFVERVAASLLLWFVISAGVFVLGAVLVSNAELARWGSEAWVTCRGPSLPQTICSEAATVPRFRVSAVLGVLGTVSTLAQSLIPPASN